MFSRLKIKFILFYFWIGLYVVLSTGNPSSWYNFPITVNCLEDFCKIKTSTNHLLTETDVWVHMMLFSDVLAVMYSLSPAWSL